MSKRLKYLAGARPEAATAYFTFLKESGRHLDDKTRFLISVVTKVASGTTAGLKQYIPHAMRAGASAQEIIDAILMSFPAAGLPKVLDALDVVQELGMPDFDLENLNRDPEWFEVGPLADLPQNELFAREYKGFAILAYLDGDKAQAWDRRCPHLGETLPENCEGDRLTCPKHEWVFEMPKGNVVEEGTRDLHTVPCKVEDGIFKVKLLVYED